MNSSDNPQSKTFFKANFDPCMASDQRTLMSIKNPIAQSVNEHDSPDFSLAALEAKRRRKRLQWCSNCGKSGHISKVCTLPILSCGIIAFQRLRFSHDFNHESNQSYRSAMRHLSNKSESNILEDLDYFGLQNLKFLDNNMNLEQQERNQSLSQQKHAFLPSSDNIAFSADAVGPEDLRYLLVRRKDSLNYVEFIRGKYDLNDIKFLYQVFCEISRAERLRIRTNHFKQLWEDLWHCNDRVKAGHEVNTSEYLHAERKFETLKAGYHTTDGKSVSFQIIDAETDSRFDTPEWGFPKGKRNRKETDFECAQREFYEETRIDNEHIAIINRLSPVSETFKGSNNIFYKHKYFIARYLSDEMTIHLNLCDTEQLAEIGDIGWFTIAQALRLFRPADVEKKTLLMRVDNLLRQLIFREEICHKIQVDQAIC